MDGNLEADDAPNNIEISLASGELKTGFVGVTFNFQLHASGTNPAAKYTFVKGGSAPAGLVLDADTGKGSWTPDKKGFYQFWLGAKDNLGNGGTNTSNNGWNQFEVEVSTPHIGVTDITGKFMHINAGDHKSIEFSGLLHSEAFHEEASPEKNITLAFKGPGDKEFVAVDRSRVKWHVKRGEGIWGFKIEVLTLPDRSELLEYWVRASLNDNISHPKPVEFPLEAMIPFVEFQNSLGEYVDILFAGTEIRLLPLEITYVHAIDSLVVDVDLPTGIKAAGPVKVEDSLGNSLSNVFNVCSGWSGKGNDKQIAALQRGVTFIPPHGVDDGSPEDRGVMTFFIPIQASEDFVDGTLTASLTTKSSMFIVTPRTGRGNIETVLKLTGEK